jgi:hypothetical protein
VITAPVFSGVSAGSVTPTVKLSLVPATFPVAPGVASGWT